MGNTRNTMFIHFGGIETDRFNLLQPYIMGIIWVMWSIGYHFFDGKHKGKPWMTNPLPNDSCPKPNPGGMSWNCIGPIIVLEPQMVGMWYYWKGFFEPWSCHVLVGFMPCLFMMTWRNFDMVADHFWFLGWTSECIFRIWLTPYVSLFVLWMVLFCLCAVGKCSSQKLGNATMMSEVRVEAGSAWYSKTR